MRKIRLVLEEMEGVSVTRFRLLYGLGYDTLYGGTRRVPTPGGRGLRRGWVDGARSAECGWRKKRQTEMYRIRLVHRSKGGEVLRNRYTVQLEYRILGKSATAFRRADQKRGGGADEGVGTYRITVAPSHHAHMSAGSGHAPCSEHYALQTASNGNKGRATVVSAKKNILFVFGLLAFAAAFATQRPTRSDRLP